MVTLGVPLVVPVAVEPVVAVVAVDVEPVVAVVAVEVDPVVAVVAVLVVSPPKPEPPHPIIHTSAEVPATYPIHFLKIVITSQPALKN